VQPAVAQVRRGGGRDIGGRAPEDEEIEYSCGCCCCFFSLLLAANWRLRASACSDDGPTEVVRDQPAAPAPAAPAADVAAGRLTPRWIELFLGGERRRPAPVVVAAVGLTAGEEEEEEEDEAGARPRGSEKERFPRPGLVRAPGDTSGLRASALLLLPLWP